MKRLLILFVAMVATAGSLSAQGWLDALKGAATEIVDEVTGGKATQALLPGKWSYTSPAVRLTSSDMLASTLSSGVSQTIEAKLQKAYDFVGIKPGSSAFTFNTDGSFTAVMGKRSLAGTYTYDATSHAIELKFSTKLLNLRSMKGYAFLDGEKMELVFDCTKLFDLLTALGSKSSSLGTITELVKNYDGMMLGFGYNR